MNAVDFPAIQIPTVERANETPASSGVDLGAKFAEALDGARALENSSESAANRFAAGDPSVGIHEVVIEAEKASIALRYATTLKNKAVEAYRELMNTQV
jgi:flagellar hook-basal body complex protein FliE